MEHDDNNDNNKCEEYFKTGERAGKRCINDVKFTIDGKGLCGLHSKGKKKAGEEVVAVSLASKGSSAATNVLKKKKEEDYKLHLDTVKEALEKNKSDSVVGDVILDKMLFKEPTLLRAGYLNIYPLKGNKNKKDGIACSSLSPFEIGPIQHGGADTLVPDAPDLGTFYYASMIRKGQDKKQFDEKRLKFYANPKNKGLKAKTGDVTGFFYAGEDGVEQELDELQFRIVFARLYEEKIRDLPEFKMLLDRVNSGENVCIRGYTASPIRKGFIEDFATQYEDGNRYCYENILATMLALPEEEYPWREPIQ